MLQSGVIHPNAFQKQNNRLNWEELGKLGRAGKTGKSWENWEELGKLGRAGFPD